MWDVLAPLIRVEYFRLTTDWKRHPDTIGYSCYLTDSSQVPHGLPSLIRHRDSNFSDLSASMWYHYSILYLHQSFAAIWADKAAVLLCVFTAHSFWDVGRWFLSSYPCVCVQFFLPLSLCRSGAPPYQEAFSSPDMGPWCRAHSALFL